MPDPPTRSRYSPGLPFITGSSVLTKPARTATPDAARTQPQGSRSEVRSPTGTIFFDLAHTLATATTQSPRRLVASKLGLSEKQTRKVGRLIMTYPATDPRSLAHALTELLIHHDRHQLERVLEEIWEDQRLSVRTIDGTLQVLEALKTGGYGLGLLSNTWHPLYQGFLRDCPEIEALLDHVLLSYRLGCKKPSGEIFQLALAEAGASAEQCWMIGDSYELDIEPARMAGMHTIWVLSRPEKERPLLVELLQGEKPLPDRSVVHLNEVLEYFI